MLQVCVSPHSEAYVISRPLCWHRFSLNQRQCSQFPSNSWCDFQRFCHGLSLPHYKSPLFFWVHSNYSLKRMGSHDTRVSTAQRGKFQFLTTHLMYHGEFLKQKRSAGFATHAGRIKNTSINKTFKNTPCWGFNIKRKEVKDSFFDQFWSFYKIPRWTLKAQEEQRNGVRDTLGWTVLTNTETSDNFASTKKYSNKVQNLCLIPQRLPKKMKTQLVLFKRVP